MVFNYPNLKCNYVRIGIALYGILSFPNDTTKLQLDLRPVLSLKSQVILIRKIQKMIVLDMEESLLQAEIA